MTKEDSNKEQEIALFREIFTNFEKDIAEISKHFQSVIKALHEEIQKNLAPLKQLQEYLRDNWEQIQKVLLEVKDAFQRLPENIRHTLTILGKRGWFISLEMPASPTFKLVTEFPEEIDNRMSQFYREHLDYIERDIKKRFPHRATIIETAFNAHRRGEYELSVPVILAQADGICSELIGIQLYSKQSGIPKTAEYIEQLAIDEFLKSVLEPLRIPLPILESKWGSCDEENDILNRHLILHGKCTDYNTKTNSLRVISLIHYVSWVLDLATNK